MKASDVKVGMRVRMLPEWESNLPKESETSMAKGDSDFAPGTIHLVQKGVLSGRVDCDLFEDPEGREMGRALIMHPSCFEPAESPTPQPEDLTTWPATRGPEWRAMGLKEVMDAGDVFFIKSINKYKLWDSSYVDDVADLESQEAWTKRPAPAQEKDEVRENPPKTPKPTKTQSDLAEARKRVEALEELDKVETQIKASQANTLELRMRWGKLMLEAYPKAAPKAGARKGKG